jgi:hypothetical protein
MLLRPSMEVNEVVGGVLAKAVQHSAGELGVKELVPGEARGRASGPGVRDEHHGAEDGAHGDEAVHAQGLAGERGSRRTATIGRPLRIVRYESSDTFPGRTL